MSIFQQIGQFFARWLAQLEATFIEKQRYLLLVDGLKNTLVITLCALVIGVTIGALVAMIKYCGQGSRLLRPLCWLCDVYTTVIRGIPVVVQLLIFYFLILKSSDGLVVGIVTFGINSGAYVAELMRSGIAAVDPGQMEAGRSLGLSRLQAAWHIVLPQAMKNILPAIGNEMIALLKETAVAGYGGSPGPDPGREPDPQQHLRRLQSPAAGGGGVSAAGHRHDAAAGAAGKEAAQK